MSAQKAHADLATLQIELHAGGAGGAGVWGDRQEESFVEGAQGAEAGFTLGAEVLFVDVWAEHNQFYADGLAGTWTQFRLGFDTELDIGEVTTLGLVPWYAELGLGFGFGVGTGQQIEPPLDASEVTDKGFVAEGRIGVGYRLGKVFSLGAVIPVQTGYFIKSGAEDSASDIANHYSSVSGGALFYLRAKVGL